MTAHVEKRITIGIVDKIEDSKIKLKHYEDYKEHEVSVLFITPKEWRGIDVVEFPRRFSQQERDMLLGRGVVYTKTITYGYSADYEIVIKDKQYYNWEVKARYD